MRLLALLALGYLLYRAVKSLMFNRSGGSVGAEGGDPAAHRQQIDDAMVQDPQCGIYFAKREGVALTDNGQTLYFCCDQCRDEFVQSKSQSRPSD